MSEFDDGGPAYPMPGSTLEIGENLHVMRPAPGMTLLDWFAGQALAGLNANQSNNEDPWVVLAEQAYNAANAMLAERRRLAEGAND